MALYLQLLSCDFSGFGGLWYPSSRVQTRPKPLDFSGWKILSTPPLRGEAKPSVPCRRFTECKRSLNVMWKSGIFRQNSFLAHVVPPLAATVSWRRLVAKVGTFENKKVHKHLHLWLLGTHRRRLVVRSGTSKGSTISQYGCSTLGT